MTSFYHTTNDIAVLRERIAELSRIRTGFCAHLGSSLYKDIDRDSELYWGRESLFEGIATCDAERKRILDRIEALTNEDVAPSQEMQDAQEEELPLEVTKEMPRVTNVEREADAVVEDALNQTPVANEPVASEVEDEPCTVAESSTEIDSNEDSVSVISNVIEGEDVSSAFTFDLVDEGQNDEVATLDDSQQNATSPGNSTVVVSSPAEDDALNVARSHQATPDATEFGSTISSMPIVDAGAPHTCATCGSPVGEGDKFCMNCGAPIVSTPQSTCPNCGSVISSDYMFCMICGQRLK